MKPIAVMQKRAAGAGISLSPAAISNSSGTAPSFTFAAVTVTPIGGTPTGYVWACDNAVGGWTVQSGQGSATATARVSGAVIGTPLTCDFRCTATIGGQPYSAVCPLSYTRVS